MEAGEAPGKLTPKPDDDSGFDAPEPEKHSVVSDPLPQPDSSVDGKSVKSIGHSDDAVMIHPIHQTAWFARVRQNDVRGMTREEVDELLDAIDGCHKGALQVATVRSAIAQACPKAVVQYLDEVLTAAKLKDGEYVDSKRLLQAMRLGSSSQTMAFISRMHGRDPNGPRKLERRHFLNYLRERRDMRESCLSLPFTLFLFAIFFALVVCHFQQEKVYRLSEAIAREIPRDTISAGYPASLWTWLEDHGETSVIARYNKLVGGVRVMRTSGSEAQTELHTLCPYSMFNFVCDGFRTSGKNTQTGKVVPTRCVDQDRANATWLLTPTFRQDVVTVVSQVRNWWQYSRAADIPDGANSDGAVAALHPERVQVRMLAYNAFLDFYSLHELSIRVLDSGALEVTEKRSSFNARPVWLDTHKDAHDGLGRVWTVIIDMIFVLAYSLLGLVEMYEWFREIHHHGCRRCCSVYVSVWTAIDWIYIIVAVFITALYLYCNHLVKGLRYLVDELPLLDSTRQYTLAEIESAAGFSLETYTRDLDAVLEQAALIREGYADMYWYAAVLAGCCCLRFFKAFRGNARLNVLKETLRLAAVDLLHFLIVFAFVFLFFALIAHTTFGGRIEAFSSASEAMYSTFLVLMGFLFNEQGRAMLNHSGAMGYMWAIFFHIIMVFMMASLALAIILNVYTQVKISEDNAPSLFQQMKEFIFESIVPRKKLYEKAGVRVSSMSGKKNAGEKPPKKEAQCFRCSPTSCCRVGRCSCSIDCSHIFTKKVKSEEYTQEQKRINELKQASRKWREDRLLCALKRQRSDRPQELLGVDDLCKSLGATEAERLQLEVVFEQALKKHGNEEEAITLTDSMRLLGRIDANVRELGDHVDKLSVQAQELMSQRFTSPWAVAPMIRPPSSRTVTDRPASSLVELKVEDVDEPASSLVELKVEHVDKPDGLPAQLSTHSPEPEPPVLGGFGASSFVTLPQAAGYMGLQPHEVDALIDEQVERVSQEQARRHLRLEQAIDEFADKLQPLLERDGPLVAPSPPLPVDHQRLERIEDKIRDLSRSLAPMLEF